MILKILGWESQGMRCPDTKVDLISKNKVNVFLMNNGTGKTTTLTLIQMALTGEKDTAKITADLGDDARREPQELLHMHNQGRGTFKLKLEIDKDPYTFAITIERNVNKVNFTTTADSLGGMLPGYNPPNHARPFLTLDFVKLFVFDGEKAATLFKKSSSAKKAIDTLCQFHTLEDASKSITKYLDEKASEQGAGHQAALTRKGNTLIQYVEHLKDIKKEKADEEKDRDKMQKKHDDIELEIKDEIKKHEDVKEALKLNKGEQQDNKELIKYTQSQILQTLMNPMSINDGIKAKLLDFKRSLNQLRLPDDVAKQFFDELSEADDCICGRPIGTSEKSHIIDNAKYYLDDNTSGVLNSIKSQIDGHIDGETSLSELMSNLVKADKKQFKLQTEEERHISAVGEGNPDFENKYKEMGRLASQIKTCDDLIAQYDLPADPEKYKKYPEQIDLIQEILNIKTLENIIEKITEERDELAKTTKLRKASKLFSQIMEATKANSADEIYEGVKKKAQDHIDRILVNANPPIVIESVKDYVRIQGRSGVSEGQQLSTAYIFMLSALSYSNVEVPFIVDSPTGKLDSSVREQVGKSIPQLSSQFITFITDTEKYNFLEYIEKEVKSKASYVTIFWRSEQVEAWLKNNKIASNDKELRPDWGLVRGYENMQKYNLSEGDN